MQDHAIIPQFTCYKRRRADICTGLLNLKKSSKSLRNELSEMFQLGFCEIQQQTKGVFFNGITKKRRSHENPNKNNTLSKKLVFTRACPTQKKVIIFKIKVNVRKL